MRRVRLAIAASAVAAFLFATPSFAASPDKYQVTGEVVAIKEFDGFLIHSRGGSAAPRRRTAPAA